MSEQTRRALPTVLNPFCRSQTMRRLIYSMAAAAFLTCIAAIGFTPAQATIAPDLRLSAGSSVTQVHCRAFRHCHRRCGPRGCVRWCHRC